MSWKQIQSNSNLIQHQTNSAVLIKLPKTEWKFWHPVKLVKTAGKNAYMLVISYTDECKFKIFTTNSKNEKTAEKEINATEFGAFFSVFEGLDIEKEEAKKWKAKCEKTRMNKQLDPEQSIAYKYVIKQLEAGTKLSNGVEDTLEAIVNFIENVGIEEVQSQLGAEKDFILFENEDGDIEAKF